MHMKKPFLLFIMMLLTIIPILVLAQEDGQGSDTESTPEATAEVTPEAEATADPNASECPVIVQTAIDLTQAGCSATGNNQLCYGHLVLDAQPRINIDAFNFQTPGDVVDVIEVQSLRLSALDTQTGQWGVVLMQIEPNYLPPTVPPEDTGTDTVATDPVTADDVQVLLFGDVALNDATRFIQIRANERLNIRRHPSTSSDVIASMDVDEVITVNGRLEDSSWLRVRVQEGADSVTGWIFTDLVTPNGDVDELTPLTLEEANSEIADDLALYGPMQAFFLETGKDDAPCDEAPNSGILIQTPEGVANVTIWLDEVVIEMGAGDTAFVQAQSDGSLAVNSLSGFARVEALGETRTAVAGQRIDVPLDENLSPSDVPNDPVAIDPSDLQSLPTELLDDELDLPSSLNLATGVPAGGNWQYTWGVPSLTCPDGTEVPFRSTSGTFPLTVQSDGIRVNTISYNLTSVGVYRATYSDENNNLHQDTLQIVASDRIVGEKVLDLNSPVCTLNVPFSLTLISGG